MMNVKILLVAFALAFASCTGGQGGRLKEWMGAGSAPRVLSTTAQIGDLVSEIGGDRISAWVLIQGDLDPHSYELVKGDDEKFSRAHFIFYNGLGLEHGASLSTQLRTSSKALALGEKISIAKPHQILKKGEVVDPHIWMDISLWSEAIDPIVETLAELDPEGAGIYRERGALLHVKMEKAHLALKERMQKIPSEKRYLMTSHDAFRYFTRGYLADDGEENWAERFAAPEGLAPDGQLNPYDIQRMIAFVKERRVSVLFPESNVSQDSIQKIASAGREMGLEVRVCKEPLYGDSTSGLPYMEVMQKNGEVIARMLE